MVQPATGLEEISLGIGTLGMALGTVAFVAMGAGETNQRKAAFYIVMTFVTAIASVTYFAMFTGFGLIEVPVSGVDGPVRVYWAHYADWLFAAPLLLLALGLLAGADRNTIATLGGLGVAMVLTRLVAALAREGPATRIAWWGISSGFFVVLLYYLVGALSARAARQSGDVAALFSTLRNLTIVVWVAYPVVWILGPSATIGLVPPAVETAAYMVLDLVAKVGFGFLLLRSRGVLDQAAAAAPTAD